MELLTVFVDDEGELELRGPGDLMGTQQSGILDLLIADLSKDGELLKIARNKASDILLSDPELNAPENSPIKTQIQSLKSSVVNWSRVSCIRFVHNQFLNLKQTL